MKTHNEQKELLIKLFKENQTLTNLGILKNNGIDLFVLTPNKWEPLEQFKLPLINLSLYMMIHLKLME